MKKNCNIIKDLLPLYIDSVCSNDTKILVEEHLMTCVDCRSFADKLKENIKNEQNKKLNEIEIIKRFRKMIDFKIIKTVILGIFIGGILGFSIYLFLAHYDIKMKYNEKIGISLLGTDKKWNFNVHAPFASYISGINVSYQEQGEKVNVVFVTLKYRLYEKLFAQKKGSISTAPDLDYPNIDLKGKIKVYYTTTDLKVIKKASQEELEKIIDKSHLIFTNDAKTTRINCTLNNKNYWYSLTYYNINKQIVSGENTSREVTENDNNRVEGLMPEELLMDVYSRDGHRRSVYFYADNAIETFDNTKKYFKDRGGSCTLN